ncbi:hypothetical protein [Pedobacter immunditicola]|uniref:hypothetical protein n=1 Tax=Pedobacter immunditicola TaxID=3133440 RepID=UPI00309CD770
MELEKNRQKRLSILLAEPHQVQQQDIALLEELARQFPFFEPLHLLLAKANPEKPTALTAAALHANGALLHKILIQKEASAEIDFEIAALPIESPFTEPESEPQPQAVIQPEAIEDAFVLESISSTDFFAFEENFSTEEIREEHTKKEPEQQQVAIQLQAPEARQEEPVTVSNYDDDTLPYTFLWWLAKTRKEHQSIFQPYATVKKNKSGELQQQYVEHIFHIQSPFNAEEVINNTPQSQHIDPKETEIIDNFLKRDPQISPPKPEQIDNENKAKKSAEDHNDLVSETLAKIYIEQMLYHKAIETYQKLILKFPEKSRYFADLIQSLEKKI